MPEHPIDMESVRAVKVLVADDHPVVRSGLRHILADAPDLTVIAEAANAEQTLAAVRAAEDAVVLLDLSMPGSNGLELLIRLRKERPDLPVLVLTMYAEDQFAMRALRAGAAGYVVKGIAPQELIAAIRKVSAGGRYVSPTLAERLARALTEGAKGPPHELLSDREYQIFRKLASGQSTRSMADELGLSAKTVATYRSRVFEKLRVRTIAELAAYAVRHGLIE